MPKQQGLSQLARQRHKMGQKVARGKARPAGAKPTAVSGQPTGTNTNRLQQAQQRAGQMIEQNLPSFLPQALQNLKPKQLARLYRMMASDNPDSQSPPLKRLGLFKAAQQLLGYDQPEQQLQQAELGQLAAQGQQPNVTANLADYANSQLGQGLTAQQKAALTGQQKSAANAAYQQALAGQQQSMAASGIAPGSGIGMSEANQLAQAQAQTGAGIEQNVTLQDLAQQQQNFQNASQAASQQAQQQQATQAQLAGLANLQQQEGQYATDYTESGRQARAARLSAQQLAQQIKNALSPSTTDQVGEILKATI